MPIFDSIKNQMKMKIRLVLFFTLWVIGMLFPSCRKTVALYEDVTKESGIDFIYTFGDHTYENILESSGSGITIFDYDGDQNMDLYMMNGTWLQGISDEEGMVFKDTPNKLYRNLGNGTFEELAEAAGVDDRHWSMAAGAADYDWDGDLDLYLLNYGPNLFYENNGDGSFNDITNQVGLQGPDTLNGFEKWSVGVSFLDYDRDGLLDAFVGNFLAFDPTYISPTTPEMMPHPSEYRGQASMMYQQQKDGTFKEVTAGLELLFPDSKCMGLTVYDYDVDGDLDIFQGNDHQANYMFRNEGGVFSEVGVEIGVAVNSHGQTTGSMHGAIGDVDGDGHMDLLVPDLRYGALYRNMGNGTFEDITHRSGVAGIFSGKGQWASALFDYDNDGDLDIFSANGTAEELILQLPMLLENDGEGNFTDVGKRSGPYFEKKRSGRAAAIWDYDNDGDLDIIISHVDLEAKAVLLRNNLKNDKHWLGLTLEGEHGPSAAIGARVIVHTKNRTFVRINQWTTTYLTNNDPRLHVGLGDVSVIDQIEVYWSDGKKEKFPGPKADQYMLLKQGSSH
jgi:hypothetical protein